MKCVDPAAARRLEEAGDARALRAHRDACPACRELAALAGAAAVHPSGAALVAFEEAPGELGDGVREWTARHLETCAECRDALRSVPRLAPPAPRARLRVLPLAAAAGWLLAAFLLARASFAPPAATLLLRAHTAVLSSSRGEAPARLPPEAEVLRLRLVLAEEQAPGARLRLTFEDRAGAALRALDWVVDERDEYLWPVVTLRRAALPRGAAALRVRTEKGQEAVFALELEERS
jgi:hypothetical protein